LLPVEFRFELLSLIALAETFLMQWRFKLRLASRFEHPLLRLLILDWRFSCLLVLLVCSVFFAVTLPLRIWKRTPSGFTPEIRISTLDWLQAHALARSARKAEKNRDLDQALLSWASALANDPCDQAIGSDYIKALLRSTKRSDHQRALQVAIWLQNLSRSSVSSQLLIAAADRNQDWDLVLGATQRIKPSKQTPETQASVLKALFRRERFPEAKAFLDILSSDEPTSDIRVLYSDALNCILNAGAAPMDCTKLQEHLRSSPLNIEALEIYLMTCAQKRDATEFETALQALKQLTDQTLEFEILQIRLFRQLGRLPEARQVAARFRPPSSARETLEIAKALVAIGDRDAAIRFMSEHRTEFDDSGRHWVLYARLLVEQAKKRELDILRQEIQDRPSSAGLDVLDAGISCFLEASPADLNELAAAVARLPENPFYAEFCYFAAETLIAMGRAGLACETLTAIEPQHLSDAEFYREFFAAAEAKKDTHLMRRIAERSYQLTPRDPGAIANYAAMLVMCDEQLPRAIELSAHCLKMDPSSIPAKVNYAAALINAESFGAADLILREIDEAALTSAARNQLRFIKLKRAFKLRDQTEITRLASLLDKAALYSIQVGWLSANSI
jgi:predicted Zn-dependent protease